ncbi:MAG: sulfurtransferase [Proteobacteria bacterium]|nr:sulfurtransferase [Pseudomonadota bacterium]
MMPKTMPWTTLVDAGSLGRALADTPTGAGDADTPIVIDARFSLADPAAGEAAYAQAHLPGARYAHLDRDLADHSKRGAGRHPWPDAGDFTAVLGRWGVTPGRQVVAYDGGDGALAAARVWFLLRALGHEQVAVLDGGWTNWTASGLAVQSRVPAPPATSYGARFDQHRLLDGAQVQAHLQRGGLLLDARAAERFRGELEPLDRVAGHVPGAVNRPYADNLDGGRFKPAERLAAEFTQVLDGHAPDDVVVMCGSGVTACHHLLAMAHAGLHGAKLYTGSWSGWISDRSRPVATGSV